MAKSAFTPVVLEPGNSTRYDLEIVRVKRSTLLVIWYETRERIGGKAMRFDRNRLRAYEIDYVVQSMGIETSAAAILLAYLRNEWDIRAHLDDEYNQDTGVWVGNTIH